MKAEVEWIPVESGERPKHGECCKGRLRDVGEIKVQYYTVWWFVYGKKGVLPIDAITHWAHLPEPPKEGCR